MERTLLDQFLDEDAGHGVRLKLLDALLAPKPLARAVFEFNRFNVRVNYETKTVSIEDILEVGAEGEYQISFERFEEALRGLSG